MFMSCDSAISTGSETLNKNHNKDVPPHVLNYTGKFKVHSINNTILSTLDKVFKTSNQNIVVGVFADVDTSCFFYLDSILLRVSCYNEVFNVKLDVKELGSFKRLLKRSIDGVVTIDDVLLYETSVYSILYYYIQDGVNLNYSANILSCLGGLL